jgi:hypothetical protein
MKPKIKPNNLEEADNTLSIDEFFKQLEAKEKDLDISSEMVIEFEDSDSIEDVIPDFIKADLQPSVEIETFSPKAAAAPNDFAPVQIDVSKLQTEIQNLQNQLAQRETERLEMFER